MVSVALVKVGSPYDVANHFIDEIGAAFIAQGHHAFLLEDNLTSSPDLILSINGVALDIKLDGVPLPQLLDAVPISICVDNPLLMGWRWEAQPGGIVTVCDAAVAACFAAHHPNVEAVHYLPHGASNLKTVPPRVSRDIAVLFAATYHSPEALQQMWQRHPDSIQHWLHLQAERFAFDSACSPWVAGDSSDLQMLAAASMAAADLELYVRSLRRARLLQVMTEAGIEVTLAGKGWDQHPKIGCHRWLGEVSFPEVIALYRRAQVVLHGACSHDAHERPLTAMLQGAAVVADETPFLQRHFQLGSEVESYQWSDLPRGASVVQQLLENKTQRTAIQRAGQQAVAGAHRWSHRVAELTQKLPMVGSRR